MANSMATVLEVKHCAETNNKQNYLEPMLSKNPTKLKDCSIGLYDVLFSL
jgi:hypothetical protein